uniref:Copia protein n=1 Tax=Tanacetum cinerariifolium TaxID=118510 RepID=A0A699GSP0_TANCI|nr:copia protein [Tanacetum cinerariifolium]
MADNLPKIVWYSTHHVTLMKSWLVQKQMALGQTTTGKEISNPFMAVNDVTRLQALVDKKKVVITEVAIREVLRLDDAEGVDCIPNEEIFAELARMGYDTTTHGDDAQEPSIPSPTPPTPLPQPLQDLPSTSHRVDLSEDTVMDDASNQERIIDELDKDDVISLMDDKEDEKKEEKAKIVEDDQLQGRQEESQAEIYKIDLDHASKVLSMQEDEPAEVQEVVEVVTTAKLIIEVVTAASTTSYATEPKVLAVTIIAAPVRVAAASTKRRKGVVIRDPEEESTTSLIIPADTKSKDKGKGIMVEEPKPLKIKQQVEMDEEYARKLHAELIKYIEWDVAIDHVKQKAKEDQVNVAGFRLDYFKGISYDDIRPIFKAKFNSNIEFLLKTKEQMEEEKNRAIQSINETPAQKSAKRRKLNEEVEDLKRNLEIIPDEDDEIYTEATRLARKVPVMDYEIINLNNKPYNKIIRADGTHQLYIIFLTLLKNFDREDLEALWSLVKERFFASKPKNFFDDFLLTTLGAMFEKPDEQAQLILLVERRYPLSRFTLEQMMNAVRLRVEEESEMSLELLSNLISTVGPSRALNNDEPSYPDDPSMPHLEDIYASPTVQTRSKVNKNSEAHALKAIRTKWVYRNKKDERGVVVRNKVILVAQGHMQEEGIYYDEVFAHVARIEFIRIFLAFASYMSFIVYRMDVKSAFLYGTVDEEVYVTQPPGFVDPKFPNKVKQKEDGIFISQDKYVAEILKKFDFLCVKTASTPIKTQKPLVKDDEAANVDVHLYRFQVTPKTSHLQAVKRIFRDAYEKKLIQVLKIHTDNNVADLLTKAFDVSSNEALAIPEQTAAGKEKSNRYKLLLFSLMKDDAINLMLLVDFLNTQDIQYALMVNPTIYVLCIKQFCATVLIKKVNDVIKLQSECMHLKRGRIEAIDADEEITLMDMETQADLGAELQGRKDDDTAAIKDASAAKPTVFDDEKVTMTMAQTLIKMKDEKARLLDEKMAKMLHDAEVEQAAAREKEYNKVQTLFKPNKDKEPTKKRVAEETLLHETFKKLKAFEVSVSEFKIEALQVKYPLIDWEIHYEGSRSYWTIIRVGGITEVYQSFKDMLKGFDREDLDTLWRLVKEKFSSSVPIVDKEKALWVELKRLFEPDADDVIWKLQRKPQTKAQARKNIMIYLRNMAGFKLDYFKGMSYNDIRPIFEKYFNSNVAFLEKTKKQLEEEESRLLKRISESLEEKATKKQKLDEEVEELNKHLQIVPNNDDDVYTQATPLALKRRLGGAMADS